jgi:hypothetical protein
MTEINPNVDPETERLIERYTIQLQFLDELICGLEVISQKIGTLTNELNIIEEELKKRGVKIKDNENT